MVQKHTNSRPLLGGSCPSELTPSVFTSDIKHTPPLADHQASLQLNKEVSHLLSSHLPEIDPFWPRWKYFAERNGVEL